MTTTRAKIQREQLHLTCGTHSQKNAGRRAPPRARLQPPQEERASRRRSGSNGLGGAAGNHEQRAVCLAGGALTGAAGPRVPPQTAKHDSRHGAATSGEHPDEREERRMKEEQAEGETETGELAGTRVELIRDDWRLR